MSEEEIEKFIREHYDEIERFTKVFAKDQGWTDSQYYHVQYWLLKFKP